MTKKQKTVLFQPGPGFENAVLNSYGSVPDREFDCYAKAFYEAGRRLADTYEAGDLHRDFGSVPVVFLYRHALELYLKAMVTIGANILLLHGKKCPSIEKVRNSHRLTDFVPDIKAIFSELGWDWDFGVDGLRTEQDFVNLINEFDSTDQLSYAFRYPVTQKGTPVLPNHFAFSVSVFCLRMDPLLGAFEYIVTGLDEVWQHEAEAAAQGLG